MNELKLQTDALKAMLTGGEVIHAKLKGDLAGIIFPVIVNKEGV